MLTATCRVGRLVELRLAGNPTLEDAEQFERDAHACIAACVRILRRPVVVCTDVRASHLFRPAVSERLVQTMRGATTRLERNGLLGNGSAVLALQLARFVKETTNDARRRVFTAPEPLFEWLDEVLSLKEGTRLREFLAELDSTTLQLASAPVLPPLPPLIPDPKPIRRRPHRPGST